MCAEDSLMTWGKTWNSFFQVLWFAAISSWAQISSCATDAFATRPLCSRSMRGSKMKGRGIKSALFSGAPQKGGSLSILTGGFMGLGRSLCRGQIWRQSRANTATPLRQLRFAQVGRQKDQLKLHVTQLIQVHKQNIARGTTDPGYWVHDLNKLFSAKIISNQF